MSNTDHLKLGSWSPKVDNKVVLASLEHRGKYALFFRVDILSPEQTVAFVQAVSLICINTTSYKLSLVCNSHA